MRISLLTLLFCTLLSRAYEITVGDNASPSVVNAVKDLRHYLKATASSLKLDGKEVALHVDGTVLVKEKALDFGKLPEDEWRISSVGDNVLLYGGGERGTMYAVYRFIENYLGVRWWNPVEEYVPPVSDIDLKNCDAAGKTPFSYRMIYFTGYPYRQEFLARAEINGWKGLNREHGGNVGYGAPYDVHSFAYYVPGIDYFAKHPEYYTRNNQPHGGAIYDGQLCLSNSDVYQIIHDKLLEYIREDYEKKGNHVRATYYDISQNDNKNYCKCGNCEKLLADRGWNQTDLLLDFVNRLAREVAKEYPEVMIETLAYHYTEELPNVIRPEANVAVRLCDTNSNGLFGPLHPLNADFRKAVEDWHAICKHLLVWDYSITYDESSGLPYPSEYLIPEKMRFYADNGVRGCFFEHESADSADMHALKFYLECKYLQDPCRDDFEQLHGEFMRLYYGAAAPFVTQYREILRKCAPRNNTWRGFSVNVDEFRYITLDAVLKIQNLFEQAEEAVKGDETFTRRVLMAESCYIRLVAVVQEKYYKEEWEKAYQDRPYPLDILSMKRKLGQSWHEATEFLTPANVPPPDFLKGLKPVVYTPNGGADEVHDPECPGWLVRRIAVDKLLKYHSLPEPFGFYEAGTRNKSTSNFVTAEDLRKLGSGYHWYKCSGIESDGTNGIRLFAGGSWNIERHLPQALPLYYAGKKMDLWVRIKFEGPLYFPDSSGPNYLYVERFVITEESELEGPVK